MPSQEHNTQHEKINYVEFQSSDFNKTKAFFGDVFGWTFVDYGSDYVAIDNAGIDGGFYYSEKTASAANGSVLIVFYSEDLTQTRDRIIENGGTITQPIFDFPGGRRFHFNDLTGNEFAVWSDQV